MMASNRSSHLTLVRETKCDQGEKPSKTQQLLLVAEQLLTISHVLECHAATSGQLDTLIKSGRMQKYVHFALEEQQKNQEDTCRALKALTNVIREAALLGDEVLINFDKM